MRIDIGVSDVLGRIGYYDPTEIPNRIKHKFPIFAINSQSRINLENKIYAGISRAYMPVVFKDIIPGSVLEEVDKNLKDAFGYNLEAGITGTIIWGRDGDVTD